MTAYKQSYVLPDSYDTYWSGSQRAPLYKPPQYEPPPLRPRYTRYEHNMAMSKQAKLTEALEKCEDRSQQQALLFQKLKLANESYMRVKGCQFPDYDAVYREIEKLIPSPPLPAQPTPQTTVKATAPIREAQLQLTTPSSEPTPSQASPLPPQSAASTAAIQPVKQTAISNQLPTKAGVTLDLQARATPYNQSPCQTAPYPLYHLPLMASNIGKAIALLGDLYNEFDWKELGPLYESILLSHTLPAVAAFITPPQSTRLSHSKVTRPAQFFQKRGLFAATWRNGDNLQKSL